MPFGNWPRGLLHREPLAAVAVVVAFSKFVPAGCGIGAGRLVAVLGWRGSCFLPPSCFVGLLLSLVPFVSLSLYPAFPLLVLYGACGGLSPLWWCDGAEVRACTFAASLWVRGIRFASLYAVIRFLPGLFCAFLVLCAIVAAVMLENIETALNNYIKINFFYEISMNLA